MFYIMCIITLTTGSTHLDCQERYNFEGRQLPDSTVLQLYKYEDTSNLTKLPGEYKSKDECVQQMIDKTAVKSAFVCINK